jgi:hypothetical protein
MANYGSFSGRPKTEWLDDTGSDRSMSLIEDFWYDDPKGRRWLAPKGSIINGASIPESLWIIVGTPYAGAYRRASVVHDVACETSSILREEADTMFYWACRAGGCSFSHASLLYTGVRIGAYVFPTEFADSMPEGIPGDDAFALGARRVPELLRETTTIDRQQVAKYNEIAEELRDLDDDFESVKNAIDKMLNEPRR